MVKHNIIYYIIVYTCIIYNIYSTVDIIAVYNETMTLIRKVKKSPFYLVNTLLALYIELLFNRQCDDDDEVLPCFSLEFLRSISQQVKTVHIYYIPIYFTCCVSL